MSIAFRNEIDVTVSLADGLIGGVDILPRIRPPLARLFAGKPVEAVLNLLPRLFSLCSGAHQVAFLSAVEAARASRPSPEARHRRIGLVVTERLTELVRGLFVGSTALDPTCAGHIRSMMQAAAVLSGAAAHTGEARRQTVSRIRAALTGLGVVEDLAARPAGPLERRLAALDGVTLRQRPGEQSFLSASDDRCVLARLLVDGAPFSDAPDLDGRVPETGVWARHVIDVIDGMPPSGSAERLKARIDEAARLCAWLEARETGSEAEVESGILESYEFGNGTGAAAVECARGRLYHLVEIDDENRVVQFEYLAPTEWNFHARGPLVRSLRGASLADGEPGHDAVRAMVGSFDPCVGFSLSFREAAHA